MKTSNYIYVAVAIFLTGCFIYKLNAYPTSDTQYSVPISDNIEEQLKVMRKDFLYLQHQVKEMQSDIQRLQYEMKIIYSD